MLLLRKLYGMHHIRLVRTLSNELRRQYYHEELAPSSDVDLFIWGLDEEAALEKIKQIESSVRNAILEEVTVRS